MSTKMSHQKPTVIGNKEKAPAADITVTATTPKTVVQETTTPKVVALETTTPKTFPQNPRNIPGKSSINNARITPSNTSLTQQSKLRGDATLPSSGTKPPLQVDQKSSAATAIHQPTNRQRHTSIGCKTPTVPQSTTPVDNKADAALVTCKTPITQKRIAKSPATFTCILPADSDEKPRSSSLQRPNDTCKTQLPTSKSAFAGVPTVGTIVIETAPSQLAEFQPRKTLPPSTPPSSVIKSKTSVTEQEQYFVKDSKRNVGDVDNEKYFHGFMPREDVEVMLERDGDYLVRRTNYGVKMKKVLALSVRSGGQSQHILLKKRQDGWKVSGSKCFKRIPDLIEYHQKFAVPVTQDGCTIIIRPVHRKKWQLLHSQVTLGPKLGQGAFGDVFAATLQYSTSECPFEVAVKTLHMSHRVTKEDRKTFVKEARIMRKLKHPNIVAIIGIAAQEEPIMLAMELAPHGALVAHMRKYPNIQSKERIRYCLEAASGLRYLEANACVHRDVAARNCLLGKKLEVKISDFGLAIDRIITFKETKPRPLPVRWLAPEALKRGEYSLKSDVWSFGILMWEIFSNGVEPYPGMSLKEVAIKVTKPPENQMTHSFCLEPPEGMPKGSIRDTMKQCWAYDPEQRPNFKAVRKQIQSAYYSHSIANWFHKSNS